VYHVSIPTDLPAEPKDQSLSDAPFTGALPPCAVRHAAPDGVAETVKLRRPESAIGTAFADVKALPAGDALLEGAGVACLVVPQLVIAVKAQMASARHATPCGRGMPAS
jgi:hypothetical protein